MKNIININERGTPTLSMHMRQKLGLTGEGITLKPRASFPIEIYTGERMVEFQRNNEDVLKRFSFKKGKKTRP